MPTIQLPPAIGKNENGEDVYVTEAMIEQLINSVAGGKQIKEAENKTKQLSKEEFHKLRIRAKRDLFFLCAGVLGNDRLSPNLHGNLCTHIELTEPNRFREFLLPRGNFKSTVITVGHNIQISLPVTEEDLAYDGWWLPEGTKREGIVHPAHLGTNVKILLAHETAEGASRFLFAISNHFVTNTTLMALFPEAIPRDRVQRMNKSELELPRTILGSTEPTFDTIGVAGKGQGRHYNVINLDDIFGDKARDSDTESQTTKDWFDNIQPFFSTFKKDILKIIGTRYSFDDIYAHAHERYGKQLIKYIRKLEEPDPLNPGKTIITFPEEFDEDSIAILKKNKKVYQAQYQNDPLEGTGGFDPAWRRFYQWLSPTTIAIFTGTSREVISVRDLDIVILFDPGQGKSGGFVVTGMDWKKRVFILTSFGIEMSIPDQTDLIFNSVRRWHPRTIAVESDFFMAAFKPYWEAEMRIRGQFFHITQVKTQKRTKEDRIDGLSNYFSSAQIYMNDAQEELIEEYRVFKKSKNIHILDALAYGPEVWRAGWAPGTRPTEAVFAAAAAVRRDTETGYSAIDSEG